jgi:hypothetical protein
MLTVFLCTELHRKVVELQMSRAMFVMQHPAIATAFGGSAEARAMITEVITQAMFAGLDQVAFHEHGENVFATPGKLEQMQEDLRTQTVEFENSPTPRSGLLCALQALYARMCAQFHAYFQLLMITGATPQEMKYHL